MKTYLINGVPCKMSSRPSKQYLAAVRSHERFALRDKHALRRTAIAYAENLACKAGISCAGLAPQCVMEWSATLRHEMVRAVNFYLTIPIPSWEWAAVMTEEEVDYQIAA